MKATELLEKIRENLKDYPIDYLKNKATDDRYPDSITKRLAIYNSGIYDEIYGNEIEEDFEIRDSIIKNIEDDVDYYFSVYDPGDIETRDFKALASLRRQSAKRQCLLAKWRIQMQEQNHKHKGRKVTMQILRLQECRIFLWFHVIFTNRIIEGFYNGE